MTGARDSSASAKKLTLDVRGRAFAPGDAIRGRLTLSLDAPLEARRLTVRLEATQRSVRQAAAGGGLALSYTTETVWMTEAILDGERVYRDGLSFPFELVVPDDALRDGVTWAVRASLERPFGLNVKASVGIQLAASRRPKPNRRAKRPRP